MIRLLMSIGYKVKVVNADQSGVNRKAFSILGVTVHEPFFYVDDIKVYALFDVPHLFKSVSVKNICSFLYAFKRINGDGLLLNVFVIKN